MEEIATGWALSVPINDCHFDMTAENINVNETMGYIQFYMPSSTK